MSGSRDLTIKLWSLPQTEPSQGTVLPLLAKLTQKAHDKEIQSLAVSPNDKLIASGSRDKKAKVAERLSLSKLFCAVVVHHICAQSETHSCEQLLQMTGACWFKFRI